MWAFRLERDFAVFFCLNANGINSKEVLGVVMYYEDEQIGKQMVHLNVLQIGRSIP